MKLALFFKLAVGVFTGAILAAILFFMIYAVSHTGSIGFDGPAGAIMTLLVFATSIVGGIIGSIRLKKKYPGLIGLRILGVFIWVTLAVFIVTGIAAGLAVRAYPDGSRGSDEIMQ